MHLNPKAFVAATVVALAIDTVVNWKVRGQNVKLKESNTKLSVLAMAQTAQVLYLIDLCEKNDIEADEFDAIALNELFNPEI